VDALSLKLTVAGPTGGLGARGTDKQKGASSSKLGPDPEAAGAMFEKPAPQKPGWFKRAVSFGFASRSHENAVAKHNQEKAAFEAEQLEKKKAEAEKARVEVEQYVKTFTGDIIKNVLAGFSDEAPKLDMAQPTTDESEDHMLEDTEASGEDSK